MIDNQTSLTHILISILLLAAGALVNRYFESKAKLIVYYGHTSAGKIKHNESKQDIPIRTHSVVISNVGQKTANNVTLGHFPIQNVSSLEDIVSIYPAMSYSIEGDAKEGQQIVIPKLVPKEQIIINYVYFPPITFDQINTNVKCDEGLATVVPVLLQKIYPQWMRFISYFLFFVGLVTSIFVSYKLLSSLLYIITH